jgi:hypothetical protein
VCWRSKSREDARETGSDGGTPRIWIIANAKGLCIDGSQLDRGKNDERGAMSAGHLLTAVKAEEYPPTVWSRDAG